ncbi:MAG: STAS domain-containing protein [Actinomycetota bacterium]
MADTLCRVEIHRGSGFPVARITGEVDISNVEQIEAGLDEVAVKEPLFVVDLTETEYFDSAGIRMLFGLANRSKARGKQLRVVAPHDAIVRRVLEITHFASVVPVYPSIEEGIASL